MTGNVEAVRSLLEQKADPAAISGEGQWGQSVFEIRANIVTSDVGTSFPHEPTAEDISDPILYMMLGHPSVRPGLVPQVQQLLLDEDNKATLRSLWGI